MQANGNNTTIKREKKSRKKIVKTKRKEVHAVYSFTSYEFSIYMPCHGNHKRNTFSSIECVSVPILRCFTHTHAHTHKTFMRTKMRDSFLMITTGIMQWFEMALLNDYGWCLAFTFIIIVVFVVFVVIRLVLRKKYLINANDIAQHSAETSNVGFTQWWVLVQVFCILGQPVRANRKTISRIIMINYTVFYGGQPQKFFFFKQIICFLCWIIDFSPYVENWNWYATPFNFEWKQFVVKCVRRIQTSEV